MRGVKRKIMCGGKPVTVIVLAGGRGLRMKADKARLPVPGGMLIEHVLGQVAPYFEELLVSVSPGQKVAIRLRPTAKGGTPEPVMIEDDVPNLGPLGGILAGLRTAAHDVCAVVACDIPDIHLPYLRALVKRAGAAEIVVPLTPEGRFEPLFAVYSKSTIPQIEMLLRAGTRSVIPLFARCRTSFLPMKDSSWLRNLNTRRDYLEYLKKLKPMAGRQNKKRQLTHKP